MNHVTATDPVQSQALSKNNNSESGSAFVSSVAIVTKENHARAEQLAEEITRWFTTKGVVVTQCENGTAPHAELSLPDQTDIVLVLGGDGTLLSVGRKLLGTNIPVLGVNLGKVGFLAQVRTSRWEEQLQMLLDGEYEIKQRLALQCEVRNGDRVVFSGEAVNDMVIHRGVLARLIMLDIFVGKDRLGGLRADGLIVSTPSGSTGYAASANGPLVHPDIHAFSITPICPFMNTIPPMVLAGENEFIAHVLPADNKAFLTLDGQDVAELSAGEKVLIRAHADGMAYVQLEGVSYIERLRAKGFITDQAIDCALDT